MNKSKSKIDYNKSIDEYYKRSHELKIPLFGVIKSMISLNNSKKKTR